MSATEITDIPIAGTLQQFNRYGLPGLVIGILFLFLAGESYYGIRALINNTSVMAQMNATMHQLQKEIEKCREAR